MAERRIKIKDGNGKSKCVGIVRGDTYHLERTYKKHFFIKYDGWAVDEKVARGLEDVTMFELHATDTGTVLQVTRQEFLEKALPLHYPGHRSQLLLEDKYWKKVK